MPAVAAHCAVRIASPNLWCINNSISRCGFNLTFEGPELRSGEILDWAFLSSLMVPYLTPFGAGLAHSHRHRHLGVDARSAGSVKAQEDMRGRLAAIERLIQTQRPDK